MFEISETLILANTQENFYCFGFQSSVHEPSLKMFFHGCFPVNFQNISPTKYSKKAASVQFGIYIKEVCFWATQCNNSLKPFFTSKKKHFSQCDFQHNHIYTFFTRFN